MLVNARGKAPAVADSHTKSPAACTLWCLSTRSQHHAMIRMSPSPNTQTQIAAAVWVQCVLVVLLEQGVVGHACMCICVCVSVCVLDGTTV